MHCPQCNHDNPEGAKFCGECGAKLERLCPNCGSSNPPFGSRSFFTTLNLHSLSEAETLTIAGRVLGTDQFPPELTTALMEKAEGVPLFVEEVTKTLLDLGVLRREDGGYCLVKGIAEVNVPDTIQGIIMAQLDRLGEEGKRTVQLASVIGRQFLVRLLRPC